MSEFLKILIPIVLASLAGVLSAFATTRFKIREFKIQLEHQHSLEKEKEKVSIRLKYLNPLRVSAADLYERLSMLKNNRNRVMEIKNGAHHIKYEGRSNKAELAFWCNGVGHDAMSIIYVTAIYFSQASKIRFELPFIELGPGDDQVLLNYLSKVRTSFGGEYGIWETIQDSLGTYVRKSDGTIMNYKDFCKIMIDEAEYVWFIRLLDFYRDIDMKDNEISKITSSLYDLLIYLKNESKEAAT